MFCPECRAEYVRGITECPECHVPLVEVLPPEQEVEPNDIELVTVFETGDRMALMIAKSILDGEGIKYLVEGDRMQDILGFGGTGLTPAIPAVTIRVAKEDEADARLLLEGIGEQDNKK